MKGKRKISLWTVGIWLLLSGNTFAAEQNFGLYKRIGQDATSTYWELQWTTYLPEAEEEEPLPGDLPIPLDGGSEGGCSSEPLPGNELCAFNAVGDQSIQSTTDEPVTLPPIVITGSVALSRSYMLGYIPASARGDSGGGSSGSTFPVGVGIGRPEELGLCDTDAWENIDDTVVKRLMQSPTNLHCGPCRHPGG